MTSPDLRIVSSGATPEEIAAISAVLSAALEELAGEQRRQQTSGPSTWQRSQRNVRTPLVRGSWRNAAL